MERIGLKENRAQTSSQRQLGKLWVCATLKVSSLGSHHEHQLDRKWCARDLKDITQPGERNSLLIWEWAGWTNASGGLWVWAAVFPWFLKTYCWGYLKRETLSNNNTFLAFHLKQISRYLFILSDSGYLFILVKCVQPLSSFLFNSTWLRDKECYKWQVSVVYI